MTPDGLDAKVMMRSAIALVIRVLTTLVFLGGCPLPPLPAAELNSTNLPAPLRTLQEVRNLSPAEAARLLPVEIPATVTYFEPRWDTLFVQDATGGSYVYPSHLPRPPLRAGQQILLRGQTLPGSGNAANAIRESSIEITGETGMFPTPLRLSYPELAAGLADGRWIELEGVVRVLWAERGRFEIDLQVEGGRIRVFLPRGASEELPQHLLHARVRIRGACGLALSEHGALQGVRLFTPYLGWIAVVQPAEDPSQLPVQPIRDVRELAAVQAGQNRVSTEGTVTATADEGTFFLEDATAGLEVILVESRLISDPLGATAPLHQNLQVQTGDQVRVWGYPALRDSRRVLEEATAEIIGRGVPPVPARPAPHTWNDGEWDARLVQLHAEVLYVLPQRSDRPRFHRFLAGAGGATFEVQFPGDAPPPVAAGNRVSLVGVASAQRKEWGQVSTWRLWLRQRSDFELAPAAWWTVGPATQQWLVAGLILSVALGGWILLLVRQLGRNRLQNVELEKRIHARTLELERANSKLRQEVAERARVGTLQAAIYRISEATHSVDDLPQLYRQFHEIIGTLMPARNFYIALYDQSANLLSFPYYVDEKSGAPDPRPWSRGLTEYLIARKEPLLADDDRVRELHQRGEVLQFGAVARVWLGVPLLIQGRAIGVMAVQDYTDPHALHEEHQRILTYVAGQTAVAIERKRSETALRLSREALRASQRRFRSAFTSNPAIMSLARLRDGVLFEVNDAFVSMTGFLREEAIGHSTLDLGLWVHPEERDTLMHDVRTHGMVRNREVTIRLRDGRIRSALLAAELVEIDAEPCILTASLDVTERKEAEEKLRRALAREKELGDLKSNFVSLVSHEFRTPLEVILSSAEILQRYHDRLAPDQRARQLGFIRKSVRRMADMMNEVLLLGRFEAGRVEFHPVPLDLPAFQRRMLDEIVAAMGPQTCIELVGDDSDLEGACGDEGLLGHVFTNLLSNAVKYSPPGAPVQFVIRRDGPMAVFQIIDRGCGIPQPDQHRLFQSFHRGSNVGQRSGTGLGLVIVRRCVERHGGTIHLESTEGLGSTFTVRIPVFALTPDPVAHAD